MVAEPTKFKSQTELLRRTSSDGRVPVVSALVGLVYLLAIWAAPVLADLPTDAQREASLASEALWHAVSEGDRARQTFGRIIGVCRKPPAASRE